MPPHLDGPMAPTYLPHCQGLFCLPPWAIFGFYLPYSLRLLLTLACNRSAHVVRPVMGELGTWPSLTLLDPLK